MHTVYSIQASCTAAVITCDTADTTVVHYTTAQADPKRVAAASASVSSMTSLGDSPPDTVQACMRPCPPDSLPIMGAVDGIAGAYIAAGHNCWVRCIYYVI